MKALRELWLACFILGFLYFAGGAFPGARLLSSAVFPSQEPQEPHATPLARGKKLYLKDGSFHLVRSYEQRNGRVRYYSVERSAWEEIPADLVDWEATHKAEQEDLQKGVELLEKAEARKTAKLAGELDVDASIEVAPGVFLPDEVGLYVIEGTKTVPLAQSQAEVKLDKGRLLTQILVPVPVVPTRHKIRLAGKQAQLRLASGSPEFYMRTADEREPELELVRAKVKGSTREIEHISTYITGEQSTKRDALPVQRWAVAKQVFRLTLAQTLAPGEYAIVEILPQQGTNLYVWDFGVDAPHVSGKKPRQPK